MAIINFTRLDPSLPDLATATGRGAEQWHDRNDVNIPVEGQNTQRTDMYFRFVPTRFCTSVRKQYNWTWVDNLFNEAISKRQKLSFRLMTLYPEGTTENGLVQFDGGFASYPLWVHQAMQGEATKDWKKDSSWIQNWNSAIYQAWELEMKMDLAQHITDKGWWKVVGYIDIAFGSWGEFHLVNVVNDVNDLAPALRPTVAAYKACIDSNLKAFPNVPNVVCFAAYDGNRLMHTRTPPEVGYYALTAKNNWGLIGWRRDNWGITDGYTVFYTKENTISFNGVVFKDLIMPRYKFAPVVGEPPGWSISYNNLENQIREYHATSFGNGNYGGANTNTDNRNYIRRASKAAGYRIVLQSVDVPPPVGKVVTVKANWINEGIAPPYFDWDIVFDLVKNGTVVKSAKSTFKLKLFQPAGAATTAIDNLSFDVADGDYSLTIKVVDPNGYMLPMPLYITAAKAQDGSYSLGNVTLSGGVVVPPVNKPPVINAGPDRVITLPVNATTLVGTATDPDGTIPSDGLTWAQFEGPEPSTIVTPKAATTTVRFVKEGTYKYRLTGKDNLGATGVDEVQVIVNPAIVVPPTSKKAIGIRIDQAAVIYDDDSLEVFNPQ